MTNEEFIKSISLEGEIWKDVLGYEGTYVVSNLGRVATLESYITYPKGFKHKVKAMLRVPCVGSSGYVNVPLTKNSKSVYTSLHRLVATAFIPNPENKPCVDHIDGNKLNNHVDNLRWCTASENMKNPVTLQNAKTKCKAKVIKHPSVQTPVVGFVDGHIKYVYVSMQDALIDGFIPANISMCCTHKYNQHKGVKWMYLTDYQLLIRSENNQPQD